MTTMFFLGLKSFCTTRNWKAELILFSPSSLKARKDQFLKLKAFWEEKHIMNTVFTESCTTKIKIWKDSIYSDRSTPNAILWVNFETATIYFFNKHKKISDAKNIRNNFFQRSFLMIFMILTLIFNLSYK
jgi:hypothetical protein